MSSYLLIVSRDPYTHVSATRCYELAAALAREGNRVALFLVQNGVLPARPSLGSTELGELANCGVRVLADDFSLRERGIAKSALTPGVEAAPIDFVIEALEAGAKVVWH